MDKRARHRQVRRFYAEIGYDTEFAAGEVRYRDPAEPEGWLSGGQARDYLVDRYGRVFTRALGYDGAP